MALVERAAPYGEDRRREMEQRRQAARLIELRRQARRTVGENPGRGRTAVTRGDNGPDADA